MGKRGSNSQHALLLHDDTLQLRICEDCHKIMVDSQSSGSRTCSECSSARSYDSDTSDLSRKSGVGSGALLASSSSTASSTTTAAAANSSHLAHLRLRSGQLLLGVSGVYAAYLSYGLVQEQLYRYRDVHDGSAFTYVWFLQVLESTASIGLGVVGRYLFGGRRDLPLRPFIMSGMSQVFAKVFGSLSLAAGTSFPVATLAKSAKIVPVMLGQLVLGGSTYGLRDYLFAALLVAGTVMLSLGTSNQNQSDSSNSRMGIVFVMLSLVMDGCTGGLQKQLKRDTAATPPTTYDFLLFTHVSMLLTAFVISIITGDLWKGLLYVQQHPAVAILVTQLCGLSVMGQSFIFYVIAKFDPMVCATVTTTRKMWSVLLSIILFHHHLSAMGYNGLALALAGLAMEVQSKVFGYGRGAKVNQTVSIRKTSSIDEELALNIYNGRL